MKANFFIPELKVEDERPLRENVQARLLGEVEKEHNKVQTAVLDPSLESARHDLMAFIKATFPAYIDEPFHRSVCSYIEKVVKVRDDGTREIDRLMLWAPPQSGKLIAHETPVLTLVGWKTHGELRPGDFVFGRGGQPVRVLALSEDTIADREVEFTDGTRIVCHARHEWVVFDRSRHRPTEGYWETQAMEAAGTWLGPHGRGGRARFQVDTDEPLPVILDRKRDASRRVVHRRRGIVTIRRCEPRPGRCIQVEGSVYLVGPTLIPTHNSEIVSTRTPAFWLAHNPELPVALISYGGHLAYRNSRNARAVLDHPVYLGLFPEAFKDPGNWRQEDWHLWGHKGYCMAAGVDGPLTGHGFGLAVIDDPTENWAKAQSDLERENLWSWYNGTFLTRMWEHGAVVIMQTRWNEDDLPGRILAREGRVEEGGRWTVISYKALAEEGDILGRAPGEPLCPSRYSKAYLENLRDTMSAQAWWAEYQQTPIQPEGNRFKIGRIQMVESVPAEVAEVLVTAGNDPVIIKVHGGMRFWDLAGTAKKEHKQDPDYTVGTLLAVHKGATYVLNAVRGRMDPEQVWDLVKNTAKGDGRRVRVRIEQEPGQSGKAQIAAFVKMLQGYDIDGVPASGDPLLRTDPFAAQVNAGNVFILKGSWNREWLTELSNFPFGKHDDQVMSVATGYSSEATEQKFREVTFAHL